MSLISSTIAAAEGAKIPDALVRAGISALVGRTAIRFADAGAAADAKFATDMAARAFAEETEAANAQHYEVSAQFFAKVLGPHRKYSSCFYRDGASTLQEAEEEALRQTVEHASSAAAGARCRCGWPGGFRTRASSPSPTRIRSANTSRARPRSGSCATSRSSPPT